MSVSKTPYLRACATMEFIVLSEFQFGSIQIKQRSKLHSWRIFIFILLLSSCSAAGDNEVVEAKLLTVTKEVLSPSDIISLTDSIVVPILYSHISGLDALPIDVKKDKFISALLPAILVAKHDLQQQENRLLNLFQKSNWKKTDSLFFNSLAENYKTTDLTLLLSAVKTHPNSIILAQAAIESGWGNSRIFKEANNLFGIWSFNRNEPRIASNIKRGDKTVYLRKYDDFSQSIRGYFTTIGRTNAYADFRKERAISNNVFDLIPFLDHYSERREAYVEQLKTVIRYNNLTQYDHYQIDPAFIN